MKQGFDIGGFSVYMTAEQAERWNCGNFTAEDRLASFIHVAPGYSGRVRTLHDALGNRFLREKLDGQPAQPWAEKAETNEPTAKPKPR